VNPTPTRPAPALLTHLYAGVPLQSELAVREVARQAELGPDPPQVLGERRVAQQVDLTVGEARLHALLQQLQDVLEEKAVTSPALTAAWAAEAGLTSRQVRPTTAMGAWADWETSSRL